MAGAWLLTIPAAVLHVVTQRTPVRAKDLDRSPAATRTESRGGVAVPASHPASLARLLARSRYAQAREGNVVARGSAIVLGALGGVLCAAALIVDFIALTKK